MPKRDFHRNFEIEKTRNNNPPLLNEIFCQTSPANTSFFRKTAAAQAPLAKNCSMNAAPKTPQAPQATALRRRRRRWWRRRRHKHANCKIINTYILPYACTYSHTMTLACVTLVFKYVCGLVYDACFDNMASWSNTDSVAIKALRKPLRKMQNSRHIHRK